jgi:hypothetical protein
VPGEVFYDLDEEFDGNGAGRAGATGPTGPPGPVHPGGAERDVLSKASAADGDVEWRSPEIPLILPAALDASPYDNPYDGQTVDVVVRMYDSTVWRLRYRADLPDNAKWLFVGGPPMTAFSNPAGAGPGTSNVFAEMNPLIDLPRPGIYDVEARMDGINSAYAGVIHIYLDIRRHGDLAYNVFAGGGLARGQAGINQGAGAALFTFGRTANLPGNMSLICALMSTVGGQVGFHNGGIRLSPVRLG